MLSEHATPCIAFHSYLIIGSYIDVQITSLQHNIFIVLHETSKLCSISFISLATFNKYCSCSCVLPVSTFDMLFGVVSSVCPGLKMLCSQLEVVLAVGAVVSPLSL